MAKISITRNMEMDFDEYIQFIESGKRAQCQYEEMKITCTNEISNHKTFSNGRFDAYLK